ncbi:tyrosine-type recombinase/integrase [Microbispora sp. NBC_01189]|uniref:tyrosine-type recombinase/integrase n=1 Tax=Microbispora sp. NBC_01189 TaxID=2903583 RepID=UPI002E0F4425|nr:tyrosine-type recombinase/integrase [Microbispora sp. NBC_01189]
MRIHDLRHTFVTWLHSSGTDLKTIQGALRHTRLSTTAEVYAHLSQKVQRRAAAMSGPLAKLYRANGTEPQ